jgi:hypothetical protein
MRTAKEATLVQEEGLKLLAFGYVRSADRPARAKRTVSAKVGEKPFAPLAPSAPID